MSSADDKRNVRNTCNVCGKQFTGVGNLKHHLLVHTGEKPHQCKTCGKSFGQKGSLKVHERAHSGEKPYRPVCDICGKSFSSKSTLKNHISVHTGENRLPCDKCGKSYSKRGLRLHNCHRPTHTGNEEEIYCDKCNILFKSKDSLKIHNYIHFACDEYNISISQMGHLKLRDHIHTIVRPRICEKCGNSCSDMRCFSEHICANEGDKKCYKSFKSKDILDEHNDTHTMPISHTDNTYTNSLTSQEYFSDDDQEQEIKVELECTLEDLSDPLSIKDEI